MFDGEKVVLSKEEVIHLAYVAMEECARSIHKGSRFQAARARGEAALWEWMIFFTFGLSDEDWKTDRWYDLERIADGANV